MQLKESTPSSFPGAGDVLIASPELDDPHFAATIVYLISCDEEGAMGVILNRPVGKTLGHLLNSTSLPPFLQNLPLFYGGPVQADQFLLALFSRASEAEHRLCCCLEPTAEEIESRIQSDTGWLRALVGYAGWSAGQLEAECARGDWSWQPSDDALVRCGCNTHQWDLLHSGDERWQSLRPYFPKEWGRN